jgi:hypothetical protein
MGWAETTIPVDDVAIRTSTESSDARYADGIDEEQDDVMKAMSDDKQTVASHRQTVMLFFITTIEKWTQYPTAIASASRESAAP